MKKVKYTLLLVILLSLAKLNAQTGLYQTNYLDYFKSNGEMFRACYVWNSKSGAAIRYYYSPENKTWGKAKAALPENPMAITAGEAGEIMLVAKEYFGADGKQFRALYYYNTKTGNAVRYYLSDADKYEKSTTELPQNPIEVTSRKVGEVSMNVAEYFSPDGTLFRVLFFCNTITGKTARYYYSNEGKWIKSDTALPNNPMN